MNAPEPKRSPPRLLRVKHTRLLGPHMRRVTLSGSALLGFPPDSGGAHIKLLLPRAGQLEPVLPTLGEAGPVWPAPDIRPIARTYTVARFDAAALELDVDFVLHDDDGPASRWARQAQPGAAIGVAGPGGPARFLPDADHFLLIGDPSAYAVMAATLAALPADAHGQVLMEVAQPDEVLPLQAPPAMAVRWLCRHGTRAAVSTLLLDAVRAMPWPDGKVSVTLAGESTQLVRLRDFLWQQRGLARQHLYAVPYWKDQHTEEAYHAERHRIMDEMEESEPA